MRKLTATDSTNVRSISYDSGVDGEYIDVEFSSGATYRYTGVSQRMFLEACAAPSLGKWVNASLVKRPVDSDHTVARLKAADDGEASAPPYDRMILNMVASLLSSPLSDVARDAAQEKLVQALNGRLPPSVPVRASVPVRTGDRFETSISGSFTADELEGIGYGLIRLATIAR